jgi:hypothetical protein
MQKTIYGRRWCANDAAKQDMSNSGTVEITKMLSLNHTIYFHKTDRYRADEWLLFEMQTPWADNERALVVQRIFTREGSLVATCVQEGLMRVKRKPEPNGAFDCRLEGQRASSVSCSRSIIESKI